MTTSITCSQSSAATSTEELVSTDANSLPTDSFATGMTSVIGLSAIQKVLGLFRNILFLWLLTAAEMGRWSLALAFLTFAAPFVVAGLPGTFGKYVEYFRQRGQLRSFLRRTTAVCAVLVTVVVSWMLLEPQRFALYAFQNAAQTNLMLPLCMVLVTTISWNFLNELLTSLRMIRVASFLQFVNGASFTVVGAALVWLTGLSELAIIAAFGVSNLLSTMGAIWVLWPTWHKLTGKDLPLLPQDILQKIVPFAVGVWVANFLTNSFISATQYMLKVCGGDDALVGQFYSARVVPFILVSVSGYFSSVILPYLSHDYERGEHANISKRMNFTMKALAVSFTVLGAIIVFAAPLLFTYGYRGRYDDGLVLLPWTVAYCVWFSLIFVAQNYLWCVAKTWQGNLSLLAGLIINVLTSLILIPGYGLNGAVWSTAVSYGVTLTLILFFNRQNGLCGDRRLEIATLLPCIIGIGGHYGAALMLLATPLLWRTTWVLTQEEKREFLATLQSGWLKVQQRLRRSSALDASTHDSTSST